MKSWMRRITLGLAGLGPLLVAQTASAQPLTLASDPIERPDKTPEHIQYHLTDEQVNYADCLANGVITFHLGTADFNQGDLEVWEGDSCVTDAQRTGDNATCRQVYAEGNQRSFDIAIQHLIEVQDGFVQDTQDACDHPKAEDDKLDLHFMLMNGTNALEGFTPPFITIEYHLRGPPPPTNVRVSPGEDALVLEWDENEVTDDIVGYNFYCIDGCGAVPGAGGADGTGGVDGAGGADSGTNTSVLPPFDARCGETTSLVDSGQTDDLENGQSYTVGVAARDAFGNPGELSNTTCASPEPVTGFYEAYRAAGGKGGGGGICAFSGPARSGLGALSAGALLVLAAAARRLRSRRS